MYHIRDQPQSNDQVITSTSIPSSTSTTSPSSKKRKLEEVEPSKQSPTAAEFTDSMAVIMALDSLLGAILASRVVSAAAPTTEDSVFRAVMEFMFTSEEGKIVEKMTDLKLLLSKYIGKTNPDPQRISDAHSLLFSLVSNSRAYSEASSFTAGGGSTASSTVQVVPKAAPAPPPPPPPPPAPVASLAGMSRLGKINVGEVPLVVDGEDGFAVMTPLEQMAASPRPKRSGTGGAKGGFDSPAKGGPRAALQSLEGINDSTLSISQIIAAGGASTLKRTKLERSPGGTPKRTRRPGDDDLLTQALKKKFEK